MYMKLKYLILIIFILLFILRPQGVYSQDQPADPPKVALVLAGGSAWGLAHIGVIRVIEELGIPIDIVIGTSIGSIVGGLYSVGYTSGEIEELFAAQDWSNLFLAANKSMNEPFYNMKDTSRYAISILFDKNGFSTGGGLFTGEKILQLLDKNLLGIPSPVDFDTLPRRYRAVATELSSGDRVVFSKGNMPDALRASMSIPGVFTPWFIDGKYYIDGGVVDNLPIDVAADMGADIIIAVDLRKEQLQIDNRKQNLLSTFNQLSDIVFKNNDDNHRDLADILITVDVKQFVTTDFDKAPGLAALGEQEARNHMDQLRELRSRFPPESNNQVKPYSMNELYLGKGQNFILSGESSRDKGLEKRISKALVKKNGKEDPLDTVMDEIDNTGRYDTVRFYRDAYIAGHPLIIGLTPKPQDKNAVRLYFKFQTSISTRTEMNLDLVPALVINGITTDDSKLTADLEILDSPGVDIAFVQPIGSYLRISPYFSVKQESSINFTSNYIGYLYNTFFLSGGVNLGFFPWGGTEFGISLSYDYVDTKFPDDSDNDGFSSETVANPMLKTYFIFEKVDSPIFTSRGAYGALLFQAPLRFMGSEKYFQTLTLKGNAAIPVAAPVTLAFQWIVGTDFTFMTLFEKAPFYYLPSLDSHWMFPGPLQIGEKSGSHVAGIGFGVNYQFNWQNRGIRFPIFLLFNGALGTIIQDIYDIDWSNTFHWNASLGAGLRLNDAFGIALRFGLNQNTDKSFAPFFALDVGVINY